MRPIGRTSRIIMGRFTVALPIPKNIKQQIHLLCSGLPTTRWLEEDCLHVTLRTIDETPSDLLLDIKESLATIKQSPFTIALQNIEHVTTQKSSGILRIGLLSNAPLLNLKKNIDAALKENHINLESKSTTPHVDLGYYTKVNPMRIAEYLAYHAGFSTLPFLVDRFILYSIQTTPKTTFCIEQGVFPLSLEEPSSTAQNLLKRKMQS